MINLQLAHKKAKIEHRTSNISHPGETVACVQPSVSQEEDLWTGDSGASRHMMGSGEHVFNKKLISGSVRTANGAHMEMLCE